MNNLMWCLLSLSLFFFKLLEVSRTQYLESNYEGSTSTLSIESSTSSCSGALEILLSSSALAAAEIDLGMADRHLVVSFQNFGVQ